MKKYRVEVLRITNRKSFNPQMGDIYLNPGDVLVGLCDLTNDEIYLNIWLTHPDLDKFNVLAFGKINSWFGMDKGEVFNTKAGSFLVEEIHEGSKKMVQVSLPQ